MCFFHYISNLIILVTGSTSKCKVKLDLRAYPTNVWRTLSNEYYPEPETGHLHCYFQVIGNRNTLIEYSIIDYDLDVGELTDPNPRVMLSEGVTNTDIFVKA